MSREDSPLRDRVIFVVGARRSGTNWLQRVVCSHPDVAGVPSESFLFAEGIAPLANRFQHAAVGSPKTGYAYMERDALADALRDFCDAVFEGIRRAVSPEATRILERTPDHVRTLPLIREIYPDARVLHIIRDGRDVARSLLSQEWGPTTLADAAEEWRSAVKAGRDEAPSIEHYLEVRYETLHEDPENEIRALFAWLGLDDSPEFLASAVVEARPVVNADPSAPGVRARKWADNFTEGDIATFAGVAGGLLAELGYGDGAWRSETAGTPRAPAGRRGRGRILGSLRAARSSLDRRPTPSRKQAVAQAELIQLVIDHFLECVADGMFEEAVAMLRPAASVRVVSPHGDRRVRGEASRRMLLEALSSDAALRGRRVRSDMHPCLPTVTVVSAYAQADETVADRVFVIGADRHAVTHVTYYMLPAVARG